MFQSLRKHWRHFTSRPPGRRFKTFYEERQEKRGTGQGRKWVLIVSGVAMAAAGVLLLPLPGPGSIVLVAGLGLISSESLTMARVLDAADKQRAIIMSKTRKLWRRSRTARCLMVAAAVLLILLAAAGVLWFFLR